MMTSLVLLVPIVVSVTAAPPQHTFDDRLTSQSKDTLPVSPEVGVSSVKVDSKKTSRKQTTKVKSDLKETKIGNQDDRLSSLPRNFPVLPESSSTTSKKPFKKLTTNGTSRLQNTTKETKTNNSLNQSSSTEHPEVKGIVSKKGRKHKAFFLNYPFVSQIHHHYPNLPDYDSNFDDYDFGAEERAPNRKNKYQDSNIYYIRLPPTPYMFVPGLGYISQPPRYSTPALSPHITQVRPIRPARPPTIYQPHVNVNPFIKLPIEFVSNGKPTSVYQWPSQDGNPSTRPENHINTLDKGPYVFNGRPTGIYLLRPDGSRTVSQPIRYTDYQNNAYY